MHQELANCGKISALLNQLGEGLDEFLEFKHVDAYQNHQQWKEALGGRLPEQGIGIEAVIEEMKEHLLPNGSQIPNPRCSSYITTGATNAGVLANLAGSVASPQRSGFTAFNYLEEVSLEWMARLFKLPVGMKGIYSSGGSSANIIALGAARQWAFEQIDIDASLEGIHEFKGRCRIYTSVASHHTIQRAAGVLGFGRNAVTLIPVDSKGQLRLDVLQDIVTTDINNNVMPIAVVANLGSTSTGAIDPICEMGRFAKQHKIWFHVDGAYGLPGILDSRVRHLYTGLSFADSIIVDPHKWLGAPVGIGTTYVRERELLKRAFTQETADYLEGNCTEKSIAHSMDSLGIPYSDFGLELSAPARGAVVWALIREIGEQGFKQRICRHNTMARLLAKQVQANANLELVIEPVLSICCFRFMAECADLDKLNRRIHRALLHEGEHLPSTAIVNGKLVIRPCFIGARADFKQVLGLTTAVVRIGQAITSQDPITLEVSASF